MTTSKYIIMSPFIGKQKQLEVSVLEAFGYYFKIHAFHLCIAKKNYRVNLALSVVYDNFMSISMLSHMYITIFSSDLIM